MNNLLKCSVVVVLIVFMVSCVKEKESTIYTSDFENYEVGVLKESSEPKINWSSKDDVAGIGERKESNNGKYLHIKEGLDHIVNLDLVDEEEIVKIAFKARAFKEEGFKFRIEALENGKWTEIYNGDTELISRNRIVSIHFDVSVKSSKIRFLSSTKKTVIFIDDFSIYRAANASVLSIVSKQPILPVFKLKEINKVVQINIKVDGNLDPVSVASFDFNLEGTSSLDDLNKVEVYYSKGSKSVESEGLFGAANQIQSKFEISGSQQLETGDNYFWLSVKLNDAVDLSHKIGAACISVRLTNGKVIVPEVENTSRIQRVGVAVRQKNEDNVNTYRIPGLATTNKGTLIGVYDNRYKQGADLQGDIDVGMSRSTDGGTTWEPMKPIIDMGEYDGLPQDENGIGDPSVLVDRSNNTIWVAGVWAHGHPGKRNWWASKQGMKPAQTSQFVIAKSEDDGLTWSEPINITSQIKKKDWFLLLQGPGKGITLKDGTLVFPAQFKDDKEMPHSTIIYSKDHGKSWGIGTGAKPNTTEAQVVELEDGRLMLNMRDNRGGSRSVYTTSNLGATWEVHKTSRSALIEPVCMASLISFDHPEKGQILFFSNPNSTKGRTNITIKTSFDQGLTWPEENQIELYEDPCSGYSCMTVIDENHIGILYEGYSEMYFEKININDLLKNK